MTKAAKFFRLGSDEKQLIVRTLFWVLIYRLGLWVLPLRWTKEWVRGDIPPPSALTDANTDAVVRSVVEAVRLCSRYVPYATCLTQALTARTILHGYGQPAVMKLGVAKSGSNFEAHAWLEVNGRIVLGKQPLHWRYAVLEAGTPVGV